MNVCYENLPTAVRLIEVAPRDGWQNLEEFIPTETKVLLIDEPGRCGFKEIEISSFVSPQSIPQLSHASDVFTLIEKVPRLMTAALVSVGGLGGFPFAPVQQVIWQLKIFFFVLTLWE